LGAADPLRADARRPARLLAGAGRGLTPGAPRRRRAAATRPARPLAMNVFITGISGFVGQHLARTLLGRDHCVAGTFFDDAPELPGVELLSWELGAAPVADDTAMLRALLAR